MAYDLRYLPIVDKDLTEADVYMSEVSPDMARRFFLLLDEKLCKLRKTPFVYPIYNDYPLYRKIVVMDYLVFYRVDELEKMVSIHRIINGRMHIVNQLLES